MKHFDKEKLLMDIGNNEEFYSEIANTAKKTMTKYITNLNKAWEDKDMENVKFFSHALKGTAGSIHCYYLHNLAKVAEEKTINNQTEDLDVLINEINNEVKLIITEYF